MAPAKHNAPFHHESVCSNEEKNVGYIHPSPQRLDGPNKRTQETELCRHVPSYTCARLKETYGRPATATQRHKLHGTKVKLLAGPSATRLATYLYIITTATPYDKTEKFAMSPVDCMAMIAAMSSTAGPRLPLHQR